MSIKNSFEFKPVTLKDIKDFVEENHYSKSVNGVKVSNCFAIYNNEKEIVGACLFGQLSTTAWKKYSDSESKVVELRRLVCLEECPKNTESWFISKCINFLKKHTAFEVCISYADPRHNHVGYVYQASNWNYLGQTSKDTILVTPEGKEYHSRAMRTTYKGKLKPFAERLKNMYDKGLLKIVEVPGKYIYMYSLKGKQICNTKHKFPKHLEV